MPDEQFARNRLRPGQAAMLVLAMGLSVGFARVAGLAISVFVMRRFVDHGLHVVWAAPIGSTLVLGTIGLIAWALGGLLPALRSLPGFVVAVLTVPAIGLVLNVQGLHLAAAALLGLGMAVTAGRVAARWPQATQTLARAVIALGVSLVVVAGTLVAWRQTVDARPTGAVRGADAPDVILIVLDTVRARSLGAYGNSRDTSPAFDRIAAGGIRFDRAYAPAPWTSPSHASMMTGEWPVDLDVNWHQGLSGKYPTIAEYLRGAGYRTAGFTANLMYTGFSSGISRGFGHYEDYAPSLWNILRGSSELEQGLNSKMFRDLAGFRSDPERKRGAEVTQEFLSWLNRKPDGPYFAFLNYFDAHDPYEAAPEIEARFGVPQDDRRPNGAELEYLDWTAPKAAILLSAYEAAIADQDRQLDALFRELERRDRLRNTLVIITSDHGEEFYEHGLMWHGHTLYDSAVHVPLVIAFPGRVQPGLVVDTPVSLRSIAATIARVAANAGVHPFAGPNLLDVASGAKGEPVLISVDAIPQKPEAFPVHFGPMYSIVDGSHRYIVDGRGREELFALSDADETTNLAPGSELLLAHFREVLDRLRNR